ncbi:MAG: aspartyl/asparaginyl beta-hydroxylase domain-containing protein [Methylovulum miyakonense]|uniref:aspartyl/asparaginyl beta-hydroxylase domain-containing protein n=1 Tax=Methylovulum miyakonense TaxID=645578 RepID=UPI003BB6DA39
MNMTPIVTPLRLPLGFDAQKLQADLATVAKADWQAHFNNAIYQGDWSGVALRAVPGSHNAIYSDPTADNWQDTLLLGRCAHFQAALNQFACPLLSVRLLRLAPGALIKEHRDYGLGLDAGDVRLHLVVSTNPEVECRIDGVPYHWAEGECWYADFGLPHFFANRGDTERVHLVLDCRVNDWLLQILKAGETVPANMAAPANIEWLFQQVQSDPDFHGHLFALTDPDEFVAALIVFAHNFGRTLNTHELRDMMRQNQRSWIERDLP